MRKAQGMEKRGATEKRSMETKRKNLSERNNIPVKSEKEVWEVNIDKYLNDVSLIDSKIANKLNELNMWREIAQGIGGTSDGERVQSNGVSKKMENAVIKCVETEKEIDRLTQEKALFISRIEQLPKRHYDIMHKLYIEGYSLKAYALEYKSKYTNATSTHSRAKRLLRKVILEE